MFVGDKNENINFKKMACQCDDAIPGSFARAEGNLGTSLSNRAHRENFRHITYASTNKHYALSD